MAGMERKVDRQKQRATAHHLAGGLFTGYDGLPLILRSQPVNADEEDSDEPAPPSQHEATVAEVWLLVLNTFIQGREGGKLTHLSLTETRSFNSLQRMFKTALVPSLATAVAGATGEPGNVEEYTLNPGEWSLLKKLLESVVPQTPLWQQGPVLEDLLDNARTGPSPEAPKIGPI